MFKGITFQYFFKNSNLHTFLRRLLILLYLKELLYSLIILHIIFFLTYNSYDEQAYPQFYLDLLLNIVIIKF